MKYIMKTDIKEYVNKNNWSGKSDFETTEFRLRLNLLLNYIITAWFLRARVKLQQ